MLYTLLFGDSSSIFSLLILSAIDYSAGLPISRLYRIAPILYKSHFSVIIFELFKQNSFTSAEN
jgi:hypothetical protein